MEGFGSIISDTITKEENDVLNLRKITKIGTTEFGKSGKPLEVLEKFGLGEKEITSKILQIINRK
jgi:hypothetical protein